MRVGSRMAKAGRLKGVLQPRLLSVASSVKTAESLVSLPAAAMVSTLPTGRAPVMGRTLQK